MNNINKVKPIVLSNFFKLLDAKNICDLSINEIASKSGVARSSFYRNFNSIDDIVNYFYESIYLSKNELNKFTYKTYLDFIANSFNSINKYTHELSLLYKNRLLDSLNNYLLDNIKFICDYNHTYIDIFQVNFYVSTYVSILISYIENNFLLDIEDIKRKFKSYLGYNIDRSISLNKESIEVISVNNMRESDSYTIKNFIDSKTLMYNAGLGVFNNVNWFGKIAIICGKGNNAGDGYVLAKLLKENNYDVDIYLVEEKFSKDGEYYFNLAKDIGVKYYLINENTDLTKYNILVDCLLGTGFIGEVKDNIKLAINKINSSNVYVVSVDINSGLNGDNGLASLAVKSDLTISIGSYKSGHFLNSAKDYIKEVKNIDIDIKPLYKEFILLGSEEVNKILKPRKNLSNKGNYGYIALIGGSKLYSGAIRLANLANSSMRMGAGVVLLATPKSISDYIIPQILESTIYPMSEMDGYISFNKIELDSLMDRCKCIAIGMGMGLTVDTPKIVEYLLTRYEGVLVIDADGLNALSKLDKKILFNSKAKVILTPHIKEFSRLTNKSIEEINIDPIKLVKQFSLENNCITLLKGPTTIVTDGKNTYLVNKGSSGMATAGSGDVLSGIIASLVSSNLDNLLLAVASSSYINGLAGELASLENGDISMIASDTAKYLPLAIKLIK